MTPRDTRTGSVLEAMVLPALEQGGYTYQRQVKIGQRPGGGTHKVDVVATKGGRKIIISLKWQQVGGTAEQKVPFEVICLADAVRIRKLDCAYLVLGGKGWTLRDFYTSGGLNGYLNPEIPKVVHILTLESFIGLANKGKL